ncbi:prophage antirepressor [Lactobacillus helveticus]|uniref:Prophage antirepressor n=2 Tax=Lactobacillus helveticus TaxID=1587 RepID=A0A386RDU1_LACHE|nr:prophage antirepressor [Lactobacillus helveticus]
MMSNLQFFNFEGNEVRGILINDEPCFVGTDVANILGYADSTRAINQHVDKEDRKSLSYKASGDLIPSLWKKKNDFSNKVLITESGVYSLIFGSQQPNAKIFKHWVTSEVLPAIRKHGAYMTDQKAFDVVHNKNGLADLLQQAADQLKQKDIRIEEVEAENKNLTIQLEESNKKASYLDLILGDPTPILITQIANDYGYSAVAFNRLLKKFKVQRRVNGQWILYKAYMGKGYTSTKSKTYQDKKGNLRTKIYTVWTQKGRRFIYDILKENNVLPLIEREDVA